MIHFLPTFLLKWGTKKNKLCTLTFPVLHNIRPQYHYTKKISCSTRHHQHFEVKDDVGAQVILNYNYVKEALIYSGRFGSFHITSTILPIT